jgi:serine protease inhibitor
MRKVRVVILLVFVCCFLLQCSHKPDVVTPPQATVRTPAQLNQTEKSLVESVNRFSFKLLKAVNNGANPNTNVFISPLSVSYALGLLRNGAAGATRAGIDSLLELSGLSIDDANQAYQSLTAILTQADSAVAFNVANSFWYRDNAKVQSAFIEAGRDYFDAQVEAVDFQDPATAARINDWVKDNTGGLIDKIVEPPLSSDIIAMLLNALCFKGGWTYPFDTAYTHDGIFHTPGGAEVRCPFMNKDVDADSLASGEMFSHSPITCFGDSTIFGMTLPYGSHGFKMTLVLPKGSMTADQIISGLTQETWNCWMSASRVAKPWFKLPKFEFAFEAGLTDILKALGMSASFDPDAADFSNLFVGGGACLSEVRHKAFVKVDEKGTSAAAVTIGTVVSTVWGPTLFNHPFLFVIHETESGAILFMGKVTNPTLKS